MAGRNQGLFEVDSDEDSINTTTTAESEWNGTGEYAVERILAEDISPDGQIQYLLKWEAYPLHRCTWETGDNITSPLVLRDWHNEKLAVKRGEKEPFDINEFNLAVESWMDEVEDKQKRRIAKRRKRGEPVYSPEEGEESEDELTKPVSPKRTKAKATPLKRKGVAQPVTKGRARVLTLDDEDDSSEDTDSESDSLRARKARTSVFAPQKKTKTTAVSTTPRPQEETASRVGPTPPSSKAKKQPVVEKKDSGIAQISANPTKTSDSNLAPTSSTTGARKSVQATAAKTAPQKRPSTSNVFGGDWAKEKQRRQRARVSGETSKDSVDPKFTHLSIQNRYQKHGRNEPAPDPNALTMVNPKTGKMQPPKTAPAKVGPTEIHRAYGRRTPPPTSKARSPSPPTPVPPPPPATRRVSLQPTINTDVENSIFPIDTPKSAAGVPLKQITCTFWQSGTCRYTADQCSYAHSYGPSVVRSKKLTTCYYWKNGGFCRYSADQCEFAHFDTGIYAGAPGTFRRNSTAPNIADIKASDLRLTAASSSPSEVFFDAPEQPPPLPPSESAVTSESEVVFSETPGQATITVPSEPAGSLTNEATNVSPTNVADPRLAGRLYTADTVTTSPAKDPRLRPPAATATTSELPIMEEPKACTYRSLETDLNMAKKYISTLDATRLLKDKKGAIEHVYIHMPPERAAELHVLRKYFQSLNCKVYSSHSDIDQWKYFRKTFEKPSCLLVFHPSELFIDTIPGLHNYLLEKGAGLRVFSIGVQHQQCIREQREPAYEAQRLFPHGGITFITDDVFVYYPEKATEIIEKFLRDAKEKPPGGQLSKIGARPGVKDWMARLASKKFEEQGGEGKCTDLRWIQCYETLCWLCPVEDEDPDFPDHSVPLETSHLWSVWEESLPSFKGRWESGDEEGATDYMANHFAGEACDKAWKYRKFLFVYQRPETEKETTNSQGLQVVKQEVDPKGWMKKYCHIGVVTPDQAPKSMRGKK